MTNKDQQWNENEYSEEETEYEGENPEAEEEYGTDGEHEDGEYDENSEYGEDEEAPKSGKSPLAVILVLLLLAAGGVAGYFFMSGKNAGSQENNNIAIENNAGGTDLSDDAFFNDNGDTGTIDVTFNKDGETEITDNGSAIEGEKDIITVEEITENPADMTAMAGQNKPDEALNAEAQKAPEAKPEDDIDNSIMISINKASRANPFKPPVIKTEESEDSRFAVIDNARFEIIEPPAVSVPDDNLTLLLSTQISGIMYDKESPSAIVKLNGSDYFVKIGDKVGDYKITKITEDKVQITYKNNSYVASVGQLFTRGILDKPAVANIENKFGGRYKGNN